MDNPPASLGLGVLGAVRYTSTLHSFQVRRIGSSVLMALTYLGLLVDSGTL